MKPSAMDLTVKHSDLLGVMRSYSTFVMMAKPFYKYIRQTEHGLFIQLEDLEKDSSFEEAKLLFDFITQEMNSKFTIDVEGVDFFESGGYKDTYKLALTVEQPYRMRVYCGFIFKGEYKFKIAQYVDNLRKK